MAGSARDRVVATTTGRFAHDPCPLERTLDHPGDPDLTGPDSFSRSVIGESTAFIGGSRALLIQTAHPEVVDRSERDARGAGPANRADGADPMRGPGHGSTR
jgi:hypothetical protein